MKKILALTVALAAVISMAACGGEGGNTSSAADDTSSATSSATSSVESVESTESAESVESVESTESTESVESVESTESETSSEEGVVSIPTPEVPDDSDTPAATDNLALSGTAFACDAEIFAVGNEPTTINDGTYDAGGYQTKDIVADAYCGINLDKAYNVKTIAFFWENAAYVDTFENDGYDIFVKDGNDWKEVKDCKVTREKNGLTNDGITDTVVLDKAVNTDGIKVVFKDGTLGPKSENRKFSSKLFELEIYAG